MGTASSANLPQQLALLESRLPERLLRLPAGAQVAVRERGERGAAPALVLLHGISSGAASWLQAVLPLPASQYVLAWDAPGYGSSTPLPQDAPHAADYAMRLHEVLQALELRRCVLVGHSLGALMACAYARLPQAVAIDRLVLISPARGYGGSPDDAARVRRDRTDALKAQGVGGLAARIPPRLLSAQAGDDAREWVRWNTARLQPRGYLQAVEMLCNSELGAVPAGIPVEVHVGAGDVVTPPAACAEAARLLGATFHTIEAAGHASPVEQPAAVAALLQGEPR
ncbi:alpha/beta hydrolase [Ramlibacter ginsenosidimutans]|uniref:Alpha/beta hydrolase n=1 Tax=Ramlibacter ginsenosidimutans TaxID=502333 RepID=A0A934TWJ8_9BURK|nr:alpha/beta hydrolase [Ramlibacter ginsenosidimutans]